MILHSNNVVAKQNERNLIPITMPTMEISFLSVLIRGDEEKGEEEEMKTSYHEVWSYSMYIVQVQDKYNSMDLVITDLINFLTNNMSLTNLCN